MSTTNDSKRKERYSEEPDVSTLVQEYLRSVDGRDGNYWQRQQVNYEARYCLWAGQSWDGRKWTGRKGGKPFPWLGASDARVMLVDKYVREDVAMLMQVWVQQKILVRPTQPAADAGWANKVTTVLRWLVYDEMEEAEDEAELLANAMLERGCAALGVWWCREEQLTREIITMRDIEAAAEQAAVLLRRGATGDALETQVALPGLIHDSAREEDVAALVTALAGGGQWTEPARARQIVRSLRETGQASFPRARIVRDRPVIRTLLWNEDIIVPPEVRDLQRSRHMFIRELLTESDLESRVRGYGYDANWVDRVIETQRGKLLADPSQRAGNRASALGRSEHDTSHLFEVATAYERLYDQDAIPGVWTTVFTPGLKEKDLVGKRELLDYAHGNYPAVEFATERRSRLLDDARGYGERGITPQNLIKRQWDLRVDRADVATLPPFHHPEGEEPDAWGPGVQLPTDRPDQFGYFEAPPGDSGSKEVELTVREFADECFGRTVSDRNAVEARTLKQDLVRGWLKGWRKAHGQILQLCQQYLPDEVWVRVVGDDRSRTLRVTREEIQGPFNVTLRFNAADLDREFVAEKMGLMQRALAFDVSGRLDRDEALIAAMELIDPSYAQRLVKPGEEASLEQIDDEQTILAKLLLGIGVDVRGGEAYALRKNALEATIQGSPTVQAALQLNPQARELVQRRLQQLDFNVQQHQVNPEIGRRLGSKPMGASAAVAAAPSPEPAPAAV